MQRVRRSPEPEQRLSLTLVEVDAADDSALDLSDVPAAVVCALCGKPDCAGCLPLDELTNASGVVAIIPWERRGHGWLVRLWATARLTTLSHREVFSGLTEGGLRAPLAFAVLSEALAAVGLTLCVGAAIFVIPEVRSAVLADAEIRGLLARALTLGLPGLVGAMVALHALHGFLVDRAARRLGSRKRGRGLRFGLYACGWDLVTMPFGLLVVSLTDGIAAARRAASLGLSIPNQAACAYLSGVHALDPERAKLASRRAVNLTGVIALLFLLAFGVVLFVLGTA